MPGFCMRMWLGKFAMIRLDTNSTIDQNRAHAWAWLVGAFALLLAVPPAGEAATAKRAPVVTPDQGIATQTKAIAKNPKNATAYLRRSDYHLALAGTDGSGASSQLSAAGSPDTRTFDGGAASTWLSLTAAPNSWPSAVSPSIR